MLFLLTTRGSNLTTFSQLAAGSMDISGHVADGMIARTTSWVLLDKGLSAA